MNDSHESMPGGTLISRPVAIISNIVVIVVSSANVVLTVLAMVTLYRCKRMAFQIKRLSYNLFLSVMFLHIVLVILSVSTFILGSGRMETLRKVRVAIFAIAAVISLAAVAILTLDRLVALTRPMTYTTLFNTRTISLLITYVWVLHTIVPIPLYLYSVKTNCNFDFESHNCEKLFLPFRIAIAVFYVLYQSFIVCVYTKMSRLAKKHIVAIARRTKGVKQQTEKPHSTTSYTIIKVVLTFQLTNFPIFIHFVLYIFFPVLHSEASVVGLQLLSYSCNCGNLYICFYLYVWRMKECRFIFYDTFLTWNKKCRAKAERLKFETYDIFQVRCRGALNSCSGGTNRIVPFNNISQYLVNRVQRENGITADSNVARTENNGVFHITALVRPVIFPQPSRFGTR